MMTRDTYRMKWRMPPRGFTLLFASLVSSLVLAVGLVMFDLIVKELELASVVRDSSYAIYTADTGLECALYWDYKFGGDGSAFATSSASARAASITCNESVLSLANVQETASAATTTFSLQLEGEKYCATVIVAKYGTPTQTTVTSHGFNTCTPGSPDRIERALQANY